MGFFDNKPQIQKGFSTPRMRAADEAVQGVGGRLQPATEKQSFFSKMKDRWNSIPQEKKSAFAQAMGENLQQQAQPQMTSINYTPQDFSWVFQPTMRMGQQYYGN